MTDPWKNLPKHYATGRWNYDHDDRKQVFFVHCVGHRILDCEDSEVAHAICLAFNGRSQNGEDRPHPDTADRAAPLT